MTWLTDSSSRASCFNSLQVLELLGCLKEGKITELGRACLFLGLNPRVACVALSGIPFGKVELSTSIAVKCALGGTVTDRMQQMYEQDLKKRVQIYARNPQVVDIFALEFTEFSTGCALLCGYPDRLAVADVENRGRYKKRNRRSYNRPQCARHFGNNRPRHNNFHRNNSGFGRKGRNLKIAGSPRNLPWKRLFNVKKEPR